MRRRRSGAPRHRTHRTHRPCTALHPLDTRSVPTRRPLGALSRRLCGTLCRLLGYNDLTQHKKHSFFLRDDGSREPVTPPIPPRGPWPP